MEIWRNQKGERKREHNWVIILLGLKVKGKKNRSSVPGGKKPTTERKKKKAVQEEVV